MKWFPGLYAKYIGGFAAIPNVWTCPGCQFLFLLRMCYQCVLILKAERTRDTTVVLLSSSNQTWEWTLLIYGWFFSWMSQLFLGDVQLPIAMIPSWWKTMKTFLHEILSSVPLMLGMEWTFRAGLRRENSGVDWGPRLSQVSIGSRGILLPI